MKSTLQQIEYSRLYRERNPEKARAACRKWRANNPEKAKASVRAWEKKNPGKMKAANVAYRAANPTKAKEWAKQWRARNPDYSYRRYGLTKQAFDSLVAEQEGCCKICGVETKLCVDHCHETQKIRGLLCHNCNVSLGLMKDSFSNLIRAADYIRRA